MTGFFSDVLFEGTKLRRPIRLSSLETFWYFSHLTDFVDVFCFWLRAVVPRFFTWCGAHMKFLELEMSPYQQMLTRDHFHNSVSDIFMRSEQFCPSHPSANWTQCSGRCGPRQLDKLAVKIGENYHGATQTFICQISPANKRCDACAGFISSEKWIYF